MKKVFLVLMFLAVAFAACGQSPIYWNSTPELRWLSAGAAPDGTDLLAGDTTEHDVYIWDMAGGDPTVAPRASLTFFATVDGVLPPAETCTVLDFPYRAEWAVIVFSRHVDGGGNLTDWPDGLYSVVAGDTASGVPFVYIRFPLDPTMGQGAADLRDSGM